jgi:hypothetical protein
MMTMTDYMLMKMEENKGLWTVGVDEYGEIVIINSNGQPCYGIQEENGQIVTAEKLIQLFNKKKTES